MEREDISIKMTPLFGLVPPPTERIRPDGHLMFADDLPIEPELDAHFPINTNDTALAKAHTPVYQELSSCPADSTATLSPDEAEKKEKENTRGSTDRTKKGKKRKRRILFSRQQTETLESKFKTAKYLSCSERESLAKEVGLTSTQVRI